MADDTFQFHTLCARCLGGYLFRSCVFVGAFFFLFCSLFGDCSLKRLAGSNVRFNNRSNQLNKRLHEQILCICLLSPVQNKYFDCNDVCACSKYVSMSFVIRRIYGSFSVFPISISLFFLNVLSIHCPLSLCLPVSLSQFCLCLYVFFLLPIPFAFVTLNLITLFLLFDASKFCVGPKAHTKKETNCSRLF